MIKRITKHKTLCVNLRKSLSRPKFSFDFEWTLYGDHKGLGLWIQIWKIFFEFEFTDNRHSDEY